jgi:hypothetical protein
MRGIVAGFLFLATILIIGSCDLFSDTNSNMAPQIDQIEIEGDTYCRSTVSLYCIASDIDDDELTYFWSINLGGYSDEGPEKEWVIPDQPDTYRIDCKVVDSEGNSDIHTKYVDATIPIPENELLLWYKFDGYDGTSDNAKDYSGNDYWGFTTGTSLTTDRLGQTDSARSFDGRDDYITIGNSNPYGDGFLKPEPEFPFTISLWVKGHNLGNGEPKSLIYTNDEYGSYYGAMLDILGDGRVQVSFGWGASADNPDGRRKFTTDDALQTNTWTHIAAVVNSSNEMKIYIDGDEVSGTYSGRNRNIILYTGQIGTIGQSKSSAYQNYDGGLDNIYIYDRELSSTEVFYLYHDQH